MGSETKDRLVPGATLSPLHAEVLKRIHRLDPRLAVTATQGAAGAALACALLFEHWPELVAGEALDPERVFYNRYYWFARFVALSQALHGGDAGLEQQAFQLIESAGFDVDMDLLQRLDARAKADTTQDEGATARKSVERA